MSRICYDAAVRHRRKEAIIMGKNLRLKAARALKGMSQKDVAEAVGVTRQTINAIESGDYNPTINLCIAICKALGKSLDELFWEEDSHES
jgi:putative transcriptional regulator